MPAAKKKAHPGLDHFELAELARLVTWLNDEDNNVLQLEVAVADGDGIPSGRVAQTDDEYCEGEYRYFPVVS